jgi:hypothetical protein
LEKRKGEIEGGVPLRGGGVEVIKQQVGQQEMAANIILKLYLENN